MADYSGLTDQELEARIAAKQHPLQAITDQELEARIAARMPREDLFGDQGRMAQSFGNAAGAKAALAAKGYVDARLNADGEYEAQKKDGTWVRDTSNFFRPGEWTDPKAYIPQHPVNWAESKLGQALPEAGKTAGNVAGAMMGAGAGPAAPVAAPVAAAALGGAGGAGGETIRQGIGRGLGTFQGEDAGETSRQATEGAASGLIGEFPLPSGMTPNKLVEKGIGATLTGGRKLLAGATSAGSGLKFKTVDTLLQNPWGVHQMGKEGADTELAKAGQKEVQATINDSGARVGYAKEALNQGQGADPIDPQVMAGLVRKHDGQMLPYTQGRRDFDKLTPEELQTLMSYGDRLRTKLPPRLADQPGVPSVSPELVRTVHVGDEPVSSHLGNYSNTSRPIVQDSVPGSTVEDLQATANSINRPIRNAAWDRNAGGLTQNPEEINIRRGMLGPVKSVLHDLDPGYAAADADYSNKAAKGELLAKLNKPDQQQSFTHTLASSDLKDNARAAAKELGPNFEAKLDPLAAATDFKNANPWKRDLFLGAGTIAGVGSHSFGTPEVTGLGLLGLGVAAATHPKVVKYGLGGTALATKPIWSILRSEAASKALVNSLVNEGDDEINPREESK